MIAIAWEKPQSKRQGVCPAVYQIIINLAISIRGGWFCYPLRNAEHPLLATLWIAEIIINLIISIRVRWDC